MIKVHVRQKYVLDRCYIDVLTGQSVEQQCHTVIDAGVDKSGMITLDYEVAGIE
jgi:hypothetical protein